MNKEQFERELQRGAAFAIASRLLKHKLITPEEYHKLTDVLDQELRSMHNPFPV